MTTVPTTWFPSARLIFLSTPHLKPLMLKEEAEEPEEDDEAEEDDEKNSKMPKRNNWIWIVLFLTLLGTAIFLIAI